MRYVGEALAGPALALPITLLLVAMAALPAAGGAALPSGGRRATVRGLRGGVAVAVPGARAAFGLVALGIGLGVPLALGLMPGSAVALVGAFGACTAGHCLLGQATGASPGSRTGQAPGPGLGLAAAPAAWFALLSLCILAPVLRFSTLDLGGTLAAQAATGPGALGGPLLLSAVDVLGGLVGLLAGAAWVEHLPRLTGSSQAEALDTALRWGESALVAAGIAALVWGPPVGALLRGPAGVLAGPVAASTLVTLGAAGLVSILRSRIGGFPATALLGTLAPVALVALLTARLA